MCGISYLMIIQARPPDIISGDEIGLLPPEDPNENNSTNITAQNLLVFSHCLKKPFLNFNA